MKRIHWPSIIIGFSLGVVSVPVGLIAWFLIGLIFFPPI